MGGAFVDFGARYHYYAGYDYGAAHQYVAVDFFVED